MTAQELLAYQLDQIGYQLAQVFHGIDESNADAKVSDSPMSPRETAAHLIECCEAAISEADGVTYDWGSAQIEDSSWSHLMDILKEKRAEAVARVTQADDEKALKVGIDYMAAHEAYHIGQMATLRIQHTPGWDPYSIYKHG